MNKKIVIIFTIALLIIIGISCFFIFTKNSDYKVKVGIIDSYSPDRSIALYNENDEKIEFKEAYYIDGVLLCYGDNPTVSKAELVDVQKLKFKLNNDEIVVANIIKEEE